MYVIRLWLSVCPCHTLSWSLSGQYRDVRDVTEELIASTTELSNSSVKLPVVNGDLIALVAVDARDGNPNLT